MIQTDYFSIDPLRSGYTRTVAGADVGEVGSENSDIPSWVDPGLETQYPRKDAGGRGLIRAVIGLTTGNLMNWRGRVQWVLMGMGNCLRVLKGLRKSEEDMRKL